MLKGIGATEIIVIAVVLIVLFGGKAFSNLAKDLGKSVKEIKKVKTEADGVVTGAPINQETKKKEVIEEGGVNK
jgi:sec-independent protein translocase protein TatA